MLQFLSTPIDNISYQVWLNKPIRAAFDDHNSIAQFYLLFPTLWLENRINRNAYPSKMQYIKKCLLHVAFYPLTVIFINALAKNLFITDSFKDIYQSRGFFGFFSGLHYQLIMQFLSIIQNYLFVENNNIGYLRIQFWMVFQLINVPVQILFQSLRLQSITGVQNLFNLGTGWFFGLVSQIIKQFKSLKQELDLTNDPRARKFIGG
ncbi:unnamed protein product [Paramecium primaurelia]|uniref:Uncharacterized protein n=1 Tax=Paramecium primaurelia TaxID=5886 RepID=A0A8S1JX91_PARPR|nr:unnamed protein product [Paramecium primaurelia]